MMLAATMFSSGRPRRDLVTSRSNAVLTASRVLVAANPKA